MDGADPLKLNPKIACPACGAENSTAALFCVRCTAPLAVASLQEFDEEDLRICRAALFEVLADAAKADRRTFEGPTRHPKPSIVSDPELWRAYVSAFWLRPETALILYAEALAIHSFADRIGAPWLDLGCGDGIHAALTAGWRFTSDFDAFQSLDLNAKDIYHCWDEKDFRAEVANRGRRVECGIDIKPTAVARAGALAVFRRVQCGDARRLPLENKSVGTIFSNMLRDLGQPLGDALRECRRVLRDDGILLLSAMTPDYAQHLYFLPAARRAEASGNTELAQRLLRLDRGRSMFCQRQLSVEHWQRLLGQYGLKVFDVRPMVAPCVIRFWDVGLRPFSMALLRQREKWVANGVLETVKAAAMELLESQLAPLVQQLNCGQVHCMNLLAVSKS